MAGPVALQPLDVVVVPFPFSDALSEKRRPAVVVSAAGLEVEHGWLWLAMVTSAPGPLRLGDAIIGDLAAAGLGIRCRVRAGKLATLNRTRILRRVGALSPADTAALSRAFSACLGV